MKMLRHTLAAVVAATIPFSAQAVSLGELTVESLPGEPLDAILRIDDVDLTVSPLLVRVAPPATYLREGVQWPSQAQDLRIMKDRTLSGVSVRVVGNAKLDGSFPLLIELNAGGSVTVRQYEISAVNGAFEVHPVAERTTVRPPKETFFLPEEAESQKTNDAAAAPSAEDDRHEETKAEAASRKPSRQGRFAPNVVKEYVALHGFDASEPFVVGQDMTLWSIVKLYRSTYEGATMEQILSAFVKKNPDAFPKGEAAAMCAGVKLLPPSTEEVFSVDPEAAFVEQHGAGTEMPAVTRQLIDAQKHSRMLAAEVGRTQQTARDSGKTPEEAAAAAAVVMEAWVRKEASGTKESVMNAPSEPTASTVPEAEPAPVESASAQTNAAETSEPAEAVEATGAVDAVGTTEPVEPVQEAARTEEAEASPEASVAPAEPSVEAAPASVEAAPQEKSGFDKAWLALAALVAAILGALWFVRRRGEKNDGSDGRKPAVVKVSREVPKTSDAQIAALKATVDECVKNGTTGGAMGVGTQAFEEAKKAQAEKSRKDAEASEAEQARKAGGIYEKQPWLIPDEGADAIAQKMPESMTPREEAVLSEAASAVSALDLVDQNPLAEQEKPLFKVKATMRPAEMPAAANPAEASGAALEQTEPRSAKEQAFTESMEAQLKLAESFIGLGALKEALELLGEIRRHGLPAQQERAAYLESRIREAEKNR